MAFRAHRLGDRRPRRLLVEIHADEAPVVEIDVVLLFRAPLAIVEDERRDGNLFAHAGGELAEAHSPRAVADVRDGRTLRRGDLCADDGWKRVAAVSEAHRGEHRARALE